MSVISGEKYYPCDLLSVCCLAVHKLHQFVHFILAISTLLLHKLTSTAEGIVINTYSLHLFKSKMLAFGTYSYLKVVSCSPTTVVVLGLRVTTKGVTMS